MKWKLHQYIRYGKHYAYTKRPQFKGGHKSIKVYLGSRGARQVGGR